MSEKHTDDTKQEEAGGKSEQSLILRTMEFYGEVRDFLEGTKKTMLGSKK